MGTAGGPGFMTEGEVNAPIAICTFKIKEWHTLEILMHVADMGGQVSHQHHGF